MSEVVSKERMAQVIEKFTSQYLKYGGNQQFMNGLSGYLSSADLKRSLRQECLENEGGKYAAEYNYVVHERAKEVITTDPATGQTRIKEKGHDGWVLADFAASDKAREAKLTSSHLATLRMYSGCLYSPWNRALRALVDVDSNPSAKELLMMWATSISILVEAVMLLSFITPQMTVLRGVNETKLRLPASFTNPDKDSGFAGGVEMSFMSTTRSKMIAMDFSGGVEALGAIFEIMFTAASRGADISHFSVCV
jgi:hypothetical protein